MSGQKKRRSGKKASRRLKARRRSKGGATSRKRSAVGKGAARRGKQGKKGVARKAAGRADEAAAPRRRRRDAGREGAARRVVSAAPPGAVAALAETRTAPELARRILGLRPRIELAKQHPSGAVDQATALRNIEHTAAGDRATRGLPGGGVDGLIDLQPSMLAGMSRLVEQEGFTFLVTEVAGGGHATHSRHYVGVAFDVGVLNGRRVSATNSAVTGFIQACSRLGATEVLGPGDRNHETHVHAAWPRPLVLARRSSGEMGSVAAHASRPRARSPRSSSRWRRTRPLTAPV